MKNAVMNDIFTGFMFTFWFFWLEFFEARANNGYMHLFKQSLVYLILK